MALYIKIPKDPNKIKDKAVGKLTKRQAVIFCIGFALGLAVYWLTYKTAGVQTAAVLFFCVGCPFFITAMYDDKSVFKLEKNVVNIIRYNIYPKIRPYKTENAYRQINEAIEYNEEVEMLETGRKKVKVRKN